MGLNGKTAGKGHASGGARRRNSKIHLLLDLIWSYFYYYLLIMGRNKMCPDVEEKEKSTGGSSHNNQRLNQWPAGI